MQNSEESGDADSNMGSESLKSSAMDISDLAHKKPGKHKTTPVVQNEHNIYSHQASKVTSERGNNVSKKKSKKMVSKMNEQINSIE